MNAIDKERDALRQLASGAQSTTESDVGPLIRRAARLVLLLLWIMAALVALVSGWLLLNHARSHTEATAISLEQYARRNIALAAFVVYELGEFLDERGGVDGFAADGAAREKLISLKERLPEGSGLILVLPDGSVALSTEPLPATPINLSDRLWFQAHMRDGLDSYVGPAILSRVNDQYLYTYSAAYRAPDGRILALIDLGIPSGSITGLAPDQQSTQMALVKTDGSVVAAQPFWPEMISTPFSMPGPLQGQSSTMIGTAFENAAVINVRNVAGYDLHALVSLPLFIVFAPLIWGVAIGLPLLLMLTQLLLALSRQLQEKSRQVEQALADNKVLFQEVHHRVKNNLQVISSLLRLQTERLPPELRPLLDETGTRVRAIALVHEQIYRTASPSDVQLDRFLAQLVQQLSASMIGHLGRVTTELQPVTIGLDRAVPVAILATEAITNAIKHGFDSEGGGVIGVSLESRDGRNVITVRDSGKGGVEESGAAGLGTRIMTALSRQIDGEWSLAPEPSGGMVYRLIWPA